MNEEVQSLRKRLQDLHEQHVAGFANDQQYAESRALLERKLVDAVMRSPDPDEEWPETVMMGDMRPDGAVHLPPLPMPSTNPKAGALRWLIGVSVLAIAAAALTYGWAVSSRSGAAPARITSAADGVPVLRGTAGASAPAVVVDAAAAAGSSVRPGASAGLAISGTVALSSSLAPQTKPTDAVFIFARAVEGPPMPLAVIRKQVKDLPLNFTLDDSMAMWPDAKVSAFPRVVVTARVSKSGEGQARPGDLEGHSEPVAVGATGLQIAISNVVSPGVVGR